jgi:hypothetical protein
MCQVRTAKLNKSIAEDEQKDRGIGKRKMRRLEVVVLVFHHLKKAT